MTSVAVSSGRPCIEAEVSSANTDYPGAHAALTQALARTKAVFASGIVADLRFFECLLLARTEADAGPERRKQRATIARRLKDLGRWARAGRHQQPRPGRHLHDAPTSDPPRSRTRVVDEALAVQDLQDSLVLRQAERPRRPAGRRMVGMVLGCRRR